LAAGVLLAKRDFPPAQQELAGIDPQGPVGLQAQLRMAECLYGMSRLADAEGLLKAILRDHPDQVVAHRWLAAIYYDLWAVDAALAELQQVAELAPTDFQPHRLMGVIYRDVDRFDEAAEHFAQALDRDPPKKLRREIARELARACIAKRDFAKALDALRHVDSDDVETLALRSECYLGLGDLQQAAAALEEARNVDADHRAVLMLTAQLSSQSGRPADAIPPLQVILRSDPHDHLARYRLALAYQQLGRTEDYDREIARRNESQQLVQRLHDLNVQATRQPRNAEVREQIAAVCETLGKTELAASWRRAADACRQAAAQSSPAVSE
jgi:tetratricopeptide (TPR) repeat protein